MARPGGESGSTLELLAFVPFSVATSLAFALAARRATEASARRAFLAYAASFALTALGSILSCVQQAVLGADPAYSWPNIPYLLSYPFAIAGIMAFPLSRFGREGRLRMALETAIAVAAAVTLTWLAIVRPLAASQSGFGHRLVLFAYPIGDLIMFAVLVPLLLNLRRRPDAMVLRVLGASQVLYIAGDLTYQLLATIQWPWLVFTADLLYVGGYLGMLRAAEAAAQRPEAAMPRREPSALAPQARNPLPLVLGLVIYAVLLTEALRRGTPPLIVLSVAAVGVTLLILMRESLTERLSVRLARDLEAARNEARLRGVVGYLRTGVVVVDAEGRVALANAAAHELLGYAPDTLTGIRSLPAAWDGVFENGSAAPSPLDSARLVLASGRPMRGALIGLTRAPQPQRTWLLVDVEPHHGAGGTIEEVVCTLQDLTERRALDERLRQSQRMEAVGQLAGGVAHDFNNLLTAITGYTSLLLRGMPRADPRTRDVEEILKAADRATTLTQQLLAYGRRQMLKPEVVDINEVVRDAERLLRQLVHAAVEFHFDLAADVRPVLVDRGQLEQVIVNLAVNARDAMPGGGVLTIATRNVAAAEVGLPPGVSAPADGSVQLTVSDTGTGMTPETRRRAFEPFFTTKPVGKGTGLGLSTVYGIVQQSRGDAWIESEVGRGTDVFVLLPGKA